MLLASACADPSSPASKTAAAPAKVPEKTDGPATARVMERTDAPPAAGACDVNLTADAPAADVEAGKSYCVGEVPLTRETRLEDAKKALTDCKVDGEHAGEVRLSCKGATLSFAGPTAVLSRIVPTAP
ncbi:hypothetical protein [Nannocystis pusilla]|uniref:hypothetical protein n=1 Tax=Nannocystis pusilla TaxID=889268 RepID=UPI003DA46CD6